MEIKSLRTVRWETAAKTYGNNHSTLIGLIVDWWISSAPNRCALEGGPSCGGGPKGVGRGNCDAMLLEAPKAVGVVEVEGTRVPETARKVALFLSSESPYTDLEFGVFVVYAYSPERKVFKSVLGPACEQVIKELQNRNVNKPVFVVGLEKNWANVVECVLRRRNQWYMGTPSRIHACEVTAQGIAGSDVLWSASGFPVDYKAS